MSRHHRKDSAQPQPSNKNNVKVVGRIRRQPGLRTAGSVMCFPSRSSKFSSRIPHGHGQAKKKSQGSHRRFFHSCGLWL